MFTLFILLIILSAIIVAYYNPIIDFHEYDTHFTIIIWYNTHSGRSFLEFHLF